MFSLRQLMLSVNLCAVNVASVQRIEKSLKTALLSVGLAAVRTDANIGSVFLDYILQEW